MNSKFIKKFRNCNEKRKFMNLHGFSLVIVSSEVHMLKQYL